MRTTRMFRGLSLICCLAGTLFVSDASGQGKSGQGSGLISSSTTTTCVPGFDLTCSPKVEVGITKPSVNKKALVLKRDSLPFNQSDTEIIPFKMDPSGSCGEKGIVCPSSSYDVGVKFTGQAASVTANVRGILLAKSTGAGSVCGALYVDLFVALGGGGGERRAHSKLVGRSCEQGHQSLFNSIVLTDLKAGESYVLRGRLECAYANIPQTSTGAGAGSFLCSTSGTEVTLVWPFGVKTK